MYLDIGIVSMPLIRQQDYRNIMADLKTNKIPTDVMILDMDWHWNGNDYSQSAGRGGMDRLVVEYKLDYQTLPKVCWQRCTNRTFKTALNLHPADGINEVESPCVFLADASPN